MVSNWFLAGSVCSNMGPLTLKAHELASASCFFKTLHEKRIQILISDLSYILSLSENNLFFGRNVFPIDRRETLVYHRVYQQSFTRATIIRFFVNSFKYCVLSILTRL